MVIRSLQYQMMHFLNAVQDRLLTINPIFILTPHDRTIGNTAEEIHFALMYARRNGKKLLLLRRFMIGKYPAICNKEIFHVESPYTFNGWLRSPLTFVGNLLLTIFFGHIPAAWKYFWTNSSGITKYLFRRWRGSQEPIPYLHFHLCFYHLVWGLEKIWNPSAIIHKNSEFSMSAAKSIPWKQEVEQPLQVHVPVSKQAGCAAELRRMGIPENAWFVCLHSREKGYHSDENDPRNSNVLSYLEGIELITKSGGWVVRMGDATMTRLPKLAQVIDYPFTEFKSELMDLFLLQKCRMFIGQNSGIMDIAYLFQKKCVLVNMTEWSIGFPRQKNSLAIFKHIYSQEAQRYLSIQELLTQPFVVQDLNGIGLKRQFLDNSPSEIRAVIAESLSQDDSYQYSPLQLQFMEARNRQLEQWLRLDSLHKDPEAERLLKYRISSRCQGVQATMGQKFLEANWLKNHLNS